MKTQRTSKRSRRRNRRNNRRKVVLAVLIMLFIATMSFACGMNYSIVRADNSAQNATVVQAADNHMTGENDDIVKKETKCYTTIKVSEGDTLWSIAQEHMDEHYNSVEAYIAEIVDINGLITDEIHENGYLTVAYYEYM